MSDWGSAISRVSFWATNALGSNWPRQQIAHISCSCDIQDGRKPIILLVAETEIFSMPAIRALPRFEWSKTFKEYRRNISGIICQFSNWMIRFSCSRVKVVVGATIRVSSSRCLAVATLKCLHEFAETDRKSHLRWWGYSP